MSDPSEMSLMESADPQQVAGAEDCNSTVVGASISAEGVLSDNEETSFSAGTELDEQFVSEPIPIGMAQDGLPKPLDEYSVLPIAPPFSHRALVCMEDDRQWVEIFSDEEGGAFAWNGQNGTTRFVVQLRDRYDDQGQQVTRNVFEASEVNGERFGVRTVEKIVEDSDGGAYTQVTFVRPIRPACKHYVRSVFCNDPATPFGELGHEMMYRNCSARRSVGGAFMSLNSEAVYACEMRHPRDLGSEERHIRTPDRKRLTQVVEEVPLFNLQAK